MLRVYVLPTLYSDTLEGMRSSGLWKAPAGFFYLLFNTVVPYSPRATVFRIETDRIDEPLDIDVVYETPPSKGTAESRVSASSTIIARNTIISVPIYLGKGLNNITVSARYGAPETVTVAVRTTHILALWEAFARVLFSSGKRVVDEQKNNIFSTLGSRLFQPYLSFSSMLPDVLSLQSFSSRLITRSTIHDVGSQGGVSDFYSALTLATPIFNSMDKETFELFPSLDPWANNASAYSGREAHVWIPSNQVAAWESFIQFLGNQPEIYTILSVSEDRVVVDYQGEVQTHSFDSVTAGTTYLAALAQTECFKSVFIDISMQSSMLIKLCAASYTFDLFVNALSPIGRGRLTFDSGVPFDTGRYFDSEDVDPYSDGWVGLSLTGRFEQDYPYTYTLDTFTSPAYGTVDICAYENGYHTFNLSNQSAYCDIAEDVITSGIITTGTFWVLQSPDGTFWSIESAPSGVLVANPTTATSASNFKLTRDDAIEVSFEITDAGVLQVVDPADALANLNDAMYILSAVGNLWWVRVNIGNVIYTDKVF